MKKGFLTCVLFTLLTAAGGVTTMAGGINPAASPSIAPIPPWLHDSPAAARSRDARMILVPGDDPDAMTATTSTKTQSDRTPGTPGLVFGRVGNWGSEPYYDVALMSHYAVCASFDGGMDVVDIADPADPQRVASLDLEPGGGPFIIGIAGQLAYVTNFNHGLQIVDLSRPEMPRLLSAFDPGGANDFRGLAVKGSYAYLLQGPQLHVVDVSDPGHPVAAATYTDTSMGQALAISGTTAYGLFGDHLQILDISSPTDPQSIGVVNLPEGFPFGLAAKNGYAYVTGTNLDVVDVSQPNQPMVVAQIRNVFGQYPTIRDNHLYVPVFDSSRGVLDFDISNPRVPKRVGVVNHLGVMRITAPGNYLYMAGTDGLTIMDPAAISNQPFQLGHTPMEFQLRDMERSDSILFLEHYTTVPDMALSILDMSDPAAPQVLKTLPGVTSFARQGATLYTATGGIPSTSPSRLDISFITNPTNPVTIGTLELSGFIAGLAASDGVVVGGFTRLDNDGESGLYIIDTTSASHPLLAGTLFFDRPDIMVASTLLTADRAFVLTDEYVSDPDSSGLEIFGSLNVVDISDPAHPVLTSRIDGLGGCRGLFLDGNILYAGTDTKGLLVLDVSDPDQPTELVSPPNLPFLPVSFAREGDTLVAGGLGGLFTLDVSDPSQPVFLERISSGADDVFAISLTHL